MDQYLNKLGLALNTVASGTHRKNRRRKPSVGITTTII